MASIAAKDAFHATVSFISDLRPYLPSRITVISAALASISQIADRHKDNELLGILSCVAIPLLAANLPHGKPSKLVETIGFTIFTADPNFEIGYHTALLYHWYITYAQLNPQDAFAALRAAIGVYTLVRLPLSPFTPPFPSRPLSFLVLLSLIICYRSVKSPGAAHGALPEGLNGIMSPIGLHALRTFTPEPQVQWFGYWLYFKGFCGPEPPGPWVLMYGSETVNMEGMLTATATWAFGYSPITAHIIYLVTNVVIHPFRQRLTRTGKVATPIWRGQFWGLVWFLLMHGLLSTTNTSQWVRVTSEKILGPNPHRLFTWQMVGSEAIRLLWKVFVQYFKPWYKNLRRGQSEDTIPLPFLHGPITTPNTIRILRILPSLDNTKPIHCEILPGRFFPTHSIEVYSGPKYTAISYCWDKLRSSPETQDLPTIFINSRPYQVQQTVYSILRTVRRPLSEYNIWIDSICINQSDDLEKALQVQLMRLIYENARHVAGFLRGPSNTDPGGRLETTWRDLADFFSPSRSNSSEYRAREMLGRITSTMHIHQETSPFLSGFDRDIQDGENNIVGSEEDWLALQTLITNPYFTRVWIIQEVVAARSITLNYGGQVIPWHLFARAMTIISSQGFSTRMSMYFRHNKFKSLKPIELPGVFNGLVLENLRQWYERPGFLTSPLVGSTKGMLSLEDTLKLCGRFEATREVDRVFALLGVAKDTDFLKIKVDYRSEKVRDVFVGVAKKLIAKRIVGMVGSGDDDGSIFSLLRFAGLAREADENSQDRGEKKSNGIEGLPSWVPDWTRRMDTALLTHAHKECQYRACGTMCFGRKDLKDCVKFVEGDRLMLKGVFVTRVEWLSPVFTGYPDDNEEAQRQFSTSLMTTTLHLSIKHGLNYRYTRRGSGPELVSDAFWRTLFGDMWADGRPGDLEFMKAIGTMIIRSEIAILLRNNAGDDSSLRDDLFRRGSDDGADGNALEGKIALQLNDNPDNIFNHMLMTELSNANPKHKGGFTQILGTRKIQQTPFEHPIFALGRRMCITPAGHIGLVPAGAKEGDVIAIFEGAPTPHVLRESRREIVKKDGSIAKFREHQLVGECYVHGIMDGEAVDGGDVKARHILLW